MTDTMSGPGTVDMGTTGTVQEGPVTLEAIQAIRTRLGAATDQSDRALADQLSSELVLLAPRLEGSEELRARVIAFTQIDRAGVRSRYFDDPTTAFTELPKILSASPSTAVRVNAAFMLADAHIDHGAPVQARDLMKDLLETEGEFLATDLKHRAETLSILGEAYLRGDNLSEAVAVYDQAIATYDESLPSAIAAFGGDESQARRRIKVNQLGSRIGRAEAQFKLGGAEQAVSALREVMALLDAEPDDVPPQVLVEGKAVLATILLALERHEEAVAAFDRNRTTEVARATGIPRLIRRVEGVTRMLDTA